MHHVAIMNPKLGLIEKILSGEKTIESRWLKNRSAPWLKVFAGDMIYFKDSGRPVRAVAEVEKVEYIDDLNLEKVKEIVEDLGGPGFINLQNTNYRTWALGKRYCVLIWVKNPQQVPGFDISKKGFGSGTAWLSVENIGLIKAPDNLNP